MTERQSQILEMLCCDLAPDAQDAVRALMDERAELLAVAEALLLYHGVTLDELRRPLAEIADMACNAIIKATGAEGGAA